MPSRSLYRERELRPQRNLGQAPLIWRLQYYWPSQPRQYERPFLEKKNHTATSSPEGQREGTESQRGRGRDNWENCSHVCFHGVVFIALFRVSSSNDVSSIGSPTPRRRRHRDHVFFFLSFGFEIYISIKRVFISLLGPLNPLKARCVCFPNVNQGKRSILLSTWRRSVSFFYFVLQRCGHMKQKCSYSSPELGSSRSQESGGVFRVGPRTDPPLPG